MAFILEKGEVASAWTEGKQEDFYFSEEMEGRREEEGDPLPKNMFLHHIENVVDMVRLLPSW